MDPCDIPIPAIQAGCVAAGATDSVITSAASSALDSIGEAFARGAETVLSATFEAIAATTTVDVGAAFVTRNAAALASALTSNSSYRVFLLAAMVLFFAQWVMVAGRPLQGRHGLIVAENEPSRRTRRLATKNSACSRLPLS